MGQHVKFSRSVTELHSHVAGTLNNQPTNKQTEIEQTILKIWPVLYVSGCLQTTSKTDLPAAVTATSSYHTVPPPINVWLASDQTSTKFSAVVKGELALDFSGQVL